MAVKICPICNKEFFVSSCNIERLKNCSLECRYKSQIGVKRSEETKLKIRKKLKGRIPWILGKKHKEETKNKNRLSHLGRKYKPMSEQGKNNISKSHIGIFKGDKAPWWKGGRTKEKVKIYNRLCHNRRKLLENNYEKLNTKIIQQVYEDNIKKYSTLTCYLCLKPIEFGNDNLEHKIPISRGGNNTRENLDISHKLCNLRKNTKTEEEYRKLLEV